MVRIESVTEELHLTRVARRVTGVLLLCLDSADSSVAQRVPSICEPIGAFEVFGPEPGLIETQTSRSTVISDQEESGWISYIRDVIYSVTAVEGVYLGIGENQVDVWVIIPSRDISVVRRIVETQREILRALVVVTEPVFFIDFHVLYRNGRDESQLVPEQAIRLTKPG